MAGAASRPNCAGVSVSARTCGSMPQSSICCALSSDLRPLRRVLRRCENAAVTSERSTPASPMSNRGPCAGRRRTIADHTFGCGVNAPGPTSNSDSAWADAAIITVRRPYSLVAGCAVIRSTTSFCSMKCMSAIAPCCASRRNSSGVDMLYGRLPTMRSGGPIPRRFTKSVSSTFSTWTRRPGVARASSLISRARSRSISITSRLRARSSRSQVRAPRPGPTSTMRSPGTGLTAPMMRLMTPRSCRKCWPKRLRTGMDRTGARQLDGKLKRRPQAADVRLAGARQLKRGAVIHAGAQDRQPKRHVDRAAETHVLDDG